MEEEEAEACEPDRASASERAAPARSPLELLLLLLLAARECVVPWLAASRYRRSAVRAWRTLSVTVLRHTG